MTTITLRTASRAPLAIVLVSRKPGHEARAWIKGYAHTREAAQIRTLAYRRAAARDGLRGVAYLPLPIKAGRVEVEV